MTRFYLPTYRYLTSQRCSCQSSTVSKSTDRSGRWGPRKPWNAIIFSATVNHGRNCPFYRPSQKTNEVGVHFSYCGLWLARAVRASLAITTGAGGFSISPDVSFSPVVPSDSPAFTLLRRSFPNFTLLRRSSPDRSTAIDLHQHFEKQVRQLELLFRDGKASPYDLDQDGNTILHVITTFAC